MTGNSGRNRTSQVELSLFYEKSSLIIHPLLSFRILFSHTWVCLCFAKSLIKYKFSFLENPCVSQLANTNGLIGKLNDYEPINSEPLLGNRYFTSVRFRFIFHQSGHASKSTHRKRSSPVEKGTRSWLITGRHTIYPG